MVLEIVEAIGCSWDEYCDKFSKADLKVGDYRAATFLWCTGYTATGPKSFWPVYGSTPKGSPSIKKGQSQVLMVSLCSLPSPAWPRFDSFFLGYTANQVTADTVFQWQPLPFEFFQRSWRPCCGYCGRQAQYNNLASSKILSYSATASSHQMYIHTPLVFIDPKTIWDRSPMRRKDFRKRRNHRTQRPRPCKSSSYHLWQVAIVITGVLYYFLQEDRSTLFIISMDALVAHQISLLTARSISSAVCKKSEDRWSTPPWSTPPNRSERFPESFNSFQMGYSTGFLLYLQRIWNRLMHSCRTPSSRPGAGTGPSTWMRFAAASCCWSTRSRCSRAC